MEYDKLGDEKKRHWRVVFEENGREVGDKKELLYYKRWYV